MRVLTNNDVKQVSGGLWGKLISGLIVDQGIKMIKENIAQKNKLKAQEMVLQKYHAHFGELPKNI